MLLNLLVRNVIEREIKREKIRMKPPLDYSIIFFFKNHKYFAILVKQKYSQERFWQMSCLKSVMFKTSEFPIARLEIQF